MPADIRHHQQEPCQITFKFYGSSFIPAGGVGEHLVEIRQQPTGAGLVTVYKNTLRRGDEFCITSRRSMGSPFSLSFLTDGVVALRVSTCCEFKHPPGRRLGGPSGHYAIVDITGGQRCYRCEMSQDESIQKHSRNVQKLRAKLLNKAHCKSKTSNEHLDETEEQREDSPTGACVSPQDDDEEEIPDDNNNNEIHSEEEIHTDSGEIHTEDEIDSIQEDDHNKQAS